MAISDKAAGGLMIFVASAIFVYYTIWAILLPLFNESSPIHDYFPSREWAVRIPAFILVVGLSAVGLFVGFTISNENRKKAEKAKQRNA